MFQVRNRSSAGVLLRQKVERLLAGLASDTCSMRPLGLEAGSLAGYSEEAKYLFRHHIVRVPSSGQVGPQFTLQAPCEGAGRHHTGHRAAGLAASATGRCVSALSVARTSRPWSWSWA